MVLLLRLLPPALAWVALGSTWASSEAAEAGDGVISFEPRAGKVYDVKPKLKLKGEGFVQLSAEDLQQLEFLPEMTVNGENQFEATVESDDTISLKLVPGNRWPEFNGALHLTGASHNGEALLTKGPIVVATVIPTPTVYPSNNLLYLTKSPMVMVNGTNFDEKNTALYFNPPLLEGTDVVTFVKSSTIIWVKLVQKNDDSTKWAEEPGPLKLVAISTGAGKVLLREDLGGVTIAEMQADMKGHSISVETHEEVSMYQSTKVITIAGSGFNPDGTKFRFGTTLLEGANYTATLTPKSATLTLEEGSKWRLNSAALPAPLVLLAADAGDGYVPLGSTMAKAGRKVATIFEDPKLEEAHTKIGRTLTHEIYLTGSGFTKGFPPVLFFEPHIEKEDFVVQVLNRTSIKVMLAGKGSAGRGWLPEGETGELAVKGINTGGGMLHFEKPIPVATVVTDNAPHHSGIRIFPDNAAQLYQSSEKSLIIEGEGFPLDEVPAIVFGYGGPDEDSFTCITQSETTVEVNLKAGHKWSTVAGPLSLLRATFGEHEVDFSSPGLKLAVILDNPFVTSSQLQVYTSHTKQITIQGSGFLSAFNHHNKPKVELSPTNPNHFMIKENGWTDTTITFSLTTEVDAKWAVVQKEGEQEDMKVVSIDTGGGPVSMPGGGIVVAEVRADDESFICEDSCIYANDGECDENQTGVGSLGWSRSVSDSNGGESYSSTTSTRASGSGSAMRGPYLGYATMMDAADDMNAQTPSCPIGTDCTDCGLEFVEYGKCNNNCEFARDGVCDDRRALGSCPDGTDCEDCGPWGQTNFTEYVDSYTTNESSFDQDDVGFLADQDHSLLIGQEANAIGRYKRIFKRHKPIRKESDQAEGLFMESLWAATVIVGVSVTIFIGVLLVRCARGEKIDLPTNPDVDHSRR